MHLFRRPYWVCLLFTLPSASWAANAPQLYWQSEWGARAESVQAQQTGTARFTFGENLKLDLGVGIEGATGENTHFRFRDPEASLWGWIAVDSGRSISLAWRGDFRPGWGGRSTALGRGFSTGGWLSVEMGSEAATLRSSIGVGFRYHSLATFAVDDQREKQWRSRIEPGMPPVPLDWEWIAGPTFRARLTPVLELTFAGEFRAGRWAIAGQPELLLAASEARLGMEMAVSEDFSFQPEIRYAHSWVEHEPHRTPLWASVTIHWRFF